MAVGPTAASQSQRSLLGQVRKCKLGNAKDIICFEGCNSGIYRASLLWHGGHSTYSIEIENRGESEGNVQDVLDQRCEKRISRAGSLHYIA